MYDGGDENPESSASLARAGDPESETVEMVRLGVLDKLRREVSSLWKRAPAGAEPPAGILKLEDVPAALPASDLPSFRKRIQRLRHWALQKPGDVPAEPEPAEPPKPDSADPGGNGKPPAAPSNVDEREEMRKALRAFRRDAVLARVVAEARALAPGRVIEALDSITGITDEGELELLDAVSGRRLKLDATTLRKLIPADVAAPPGVAGGSGGGTPSPMPRAGAGRDVIARAEHSQAFYDSHKVEVDAELRRRQREGQ